MKPVRFADIYASLLLEALEAPVDENHRTQSQVQTLRGGTSFLLDLSDRVLPTPGIRRVYPKSAAAEIAWFLMGSRDVTWLRKYATFWDKFVEVDGTTVERAYGYRWRHHFGRDQIADAFSALSLDPSNRRVNISAWDPAKDGLDMVGQLNVPCPTNFTLHLATGALHSSLFIRSSDIFVGLPYDVMGHAILMAAFAESLRVTLGTMHVTLANAHLYGQYVDFAAVALNQVMNIPGFRMPLWGLSNIVANPDLFVNDYRVQSEDYLWPLCPKNRGDTMKLVMAVSADGFVAKDAFDDMSWTGRLDKFLFQVLTMSSSGPLLAGRVTAANLPDRLKGNRPIVPISHDKARGIPMDIAHTLYPNAWVIGGPTLAGSLLSLGYIDRMVFCHNKVVLSSGIPLLSIMELTDPNYWRYFSTKYEDITVKTHYPIADEHGFKHLKGNET